MWSEHLQRSGCTVVSPESQMAPWALRASWGSTELVLYPPKVVWSAHPDLLRPKVPATGHTSKSALNKKSLFARLEKPEVLTHREVCVFIQHFSDHIHPETWFLLFYKVGNANIIKEMILKSSQAGSLWVFTGPVWHRIFGQKLCQREGSPLQRVNLPHMFNPVAGQQWD